MAISHADHDHPATTRARQECRKKRSGARVADMVQAHITPDAVAWGVVIAFTPVGELKVRFSDLITLYVPANEVIAVERRPD